MNARIALTGTLALAASCVALIAAPSAGATTYNNDTPILIPPEGNATPYQSSITVSGTAGPITDVNVGLDGLTHTEPDDVAVVLVAPGGQALLLQACAGGDVDAAGAFVTFDDAAASQVPTPLVTGTFKPTGFCSPAFVLPGPAMYGSPSSGETFASSFNGLSAIGTWSLFVRDNGPDESGSIPGGWSLDVKPDVTPVNPTPTPTPPKKKKCKKKKSGGKAGAAAKKRCKKKKKK
jgi:subtilisin-like proprotein convertase family protein